MRELVIKNENFKKEVMESDIPVLIDFWASWCGPCKMLSPIISEIAEEHPEIKVGKVNVDEQMELATAFQVASIPTVCVIKNGKVVKRIVGLQSKQYLIELLINITKERY